MAEILLLIFALLVFGAIAKGILAIAAMIQGVAKWINKHNKLKHEPPATIDPKGHA